MACKVISVINQKGGCAKSTTSIHLATGLARHDKRVLLVDADPQASATIALGVKRPDDLKVTLATQLKKVAQDDENFIFDDGLLLRVDGAGYQTYLMPSNIALAGLELEMSSFMNRERILSSYLAPLREEFDYIIIDNMPSLGNITINALTTADSIIIPVQPEFLSAIGMTQLLQTVGKVRRQLNYNLEISGILITMADMRNNHARGAVETIRETYGDRLRIFETQIPMGVKVREASAAGQSVYAHSPRSKVALAYGKFVDEVLGDGE